MNSYVITQNEKYFRQHRHSKTIQLSSIPREFSASIKHIEVQNIYIFLYDHHKSKIFGRYTLEKNTISKSKKDNSKSLQLDEASFRRGIFYDKDCSFKDNSIYPIDAEESERIYEKLEAINSPLRHSILSTSLKKNKFHLKYIDITKDFFIAESEIEIDVKAFHLLVKKYNDLINKTKSETSEINNFIEIGRAFMNMFLPDENFNKIFTRGNQIAYLESDEQTSLIPWTIFVDGNAFLSERIIFSYLHLKNHFYPNTNKDTNSTKQIEKIYKMAIIVIENEDLVASIDEAEFIMKRFNDDEHIRIDIYNKKLDYLEFINICESYDILHIITHGNDDGIVLSDEYLLTYQSIKNINNAPQLVFLSTCGTNIEYIYDNENVVASFLSSGVASVVSSVGKVADNSENYNFIEQFYTYYTHKHSHTSSAHAYNFATRYSSAANIRYIFFGIPIVM